MGVEEVHFCIRCLVTFGGTWLGMGFAQWALGRSKLKIENDQLRAFIKNQARRPELGPHRTAPVLHILGDSCIAAGEHGCDCHPWGKANTSQPTPTARGGTYHASKSLRPAPPPPTSVPSGGRKLEE